MLGRPFTAAVYDIYSDGAMRECLLEILLILEAVAAVYDFCLLSGLGEPKSLDLALVGDFKSVAGSMSPLLF